MVASPVPTNGSMQKNSQLFHIISAEVELYIKIIEVDEI
jgi:hypothetical protein